MTDEKDEEREPDQMFLIGRDELLCIKMLVEDDGDHDAEILQIISNACSRPHNPVPSSTELIVMANLEWENREERRGIHNREDWCCGWMAGFLSVDKPDWVKAQVQAAREDEQRKWRDERPGDLVWMTSEEEEARIRRDEREKVLEEKSKLIRDVISKDQSGLAEALAKIRTLAKGYDWIPAGEWGSYDYTRHTVETLQKECGYLLAEIEKISYEGLRDSGNRVTAHVRACEESLRHPATLETGAK